MSNGVFDFDLREHSRYPAGKRAQVYFDKRWEFPRGRSQFSEQFGVVVLVEKA